MPDPVDPKAFLTLVELAIGNMYELEAIGELLEQKGVLTKDEIIALAKVIRYPGLGAKIMEKVPFPGLCHRIQIRSKVAITTTPL